MAEFERIVSLSPAYDKRHSDPEKNYGTHGVDLRMILKGPHGATQFILFTNWQLPHVTDESVRKARSGLDDIGARVHFLPSPADLGYHWRTPRYEGQTPIQKSCKYCDGHPCYYDGSSLQAETVYETLLREGSDGVWKVLEDVYRELDSREVASDTSSGVQS